MIVSDTSEGLHQRKISVKNYYFSKAIALGLFSREWTLFFSNLSLKSCFDPTYCLKTILIIVSGTSEGLHQRKISVKNVIFPRL